MADKAYGLSATGIKRTAETNRRVLNTMPETGRRTRRVFPVGRGGGSADIIAFQITAADCEAGTATADVIAVACGGSSVAVGDEVELIDFVGCFLTGNEALMSSLKGYAMKMEADAEAGCQWHITSICCPLETC